MHHFFWRQDFIENAVVARPPAPDIFLALHLPNVACIGIAGHLFEGRENPRGIRGRNFLELFNYGAVNAYDPGCGGAHAVLRHRLGGGFFGRGQGLASLFWWDGTSWPTSPVSARPRTLRTPGGERQPDHAARPSPQGWLWWSQEQCNTSRRSRIVAVEVATAQGIAYHDPLRCVEERGRPTRVCACGTLTPARVLLRDYLVTAKLVTRPSVLCPKRRP